jgi:hypothetical protein
MKWLHSRSGGCYSTDAGAHCSGLLDDGQRGKSGERH